MRVRDATPEDWPAIWPFLRQIVRAADTFAYDPEMDEVAAREMWMVGSPGRTTVAELDGAVIGTANMYANRPGPGDHVASGNVMVDPAHWGQGAGRALLEDVIGWSRSAGFRAIQFNAVAESNERAIRLYEEAGFKQIGTVPEAFRHPTRGYVGLCVMYRPL